MNIMYVDVASALRGTSPHTQRAYQRWIRTYTGLDDLSRLQPSTVAGKLSVAELKLFLANLKAQGLGKQSLGQAKAGVVFLAQFLADAGHLSHEIPAVLARVKVPRCEAGQRAGNWLSVAEIRALLDAAGSAGHPAVAARNTAIIALMVICGLRREEVVVARWDDLIRQGAFQVLRVHGKGQKIRHVKLPEMLIDLFNQWRSASQPGSASQHIFGTVRYSASSTLSSKAIWALVRETGQRAGIPRISPHDLRRSFARGAYEAGVSLELIRQTLGHANISTTEHYINAQLVVDVAATDLFAAVVGGHDDSNHQG